MFNHVEILENLKAEVSKILVSQYDFDMEEAEEVIETSVSGRDADSVWHENAEAADIAKYLATEEDDE